MLSPAQTYYLNEHKLRRSAGGRSPMLGPGALALSPAMTFGDLFGGFLKLGYAQIINFHGIFHYKPTI